MRPTIASAAALFACLALVAPARAAPAGQESLVELLPARARAAALLRHNAVAPLRSIIGDDAEMLTELGGYLDRTLGLDLTKVDGLALFSSDLTVKKPGAAVLLRVPAASTGALKLPVVGDAGGTPLYRVDKTTVCARTRYGLAFGDEPEVRMAVATSLGREPALAATSPLGRLLSADAGDVDFVLAVAPGALPTLPISGIDDAVFTYRHNGTFELAVHGQPQQLAQLRTAAQAGEQMALTTLGTQRDEAVKGGDPWKGSSQIVAYHQVKRLLAQLDPKVEGNTLRIRYVLPSSSSSGLVFGTIGVLAGVSIESLQKYLRKSKASEARAQLRMMSALIVAWGQEKGHRPALLHSTELAPAAKCCGQPEDKCAVEPHAFDGPTWKALGIRVDDASRYQYRIIVDTKHRPAQITVEAHGDLDCDQKSSTFRQTVTFGPNGPEAAAIEVQDEDE